jgi:L-xylulokinase
MSRSVPADDAVFLGIDIGGSVVKAAAFDGDGHEIACSGGHLASVHPAAGRNERQPEDMWQAVVTAVRGVIAALPGGAATIRAIGCAGHGNGLYLLDENGQALGRGIVSSDTRGAALLAEFEAHGDAPSIMRRRGQRFGTSEPSMLMSWLDRHEPERVGRVGAILLCKDYVRLRLTDRLGTDLCDASGGALIEVTSQTYAHENFHRIGLSHWLEKLPAIDRSTTIVGGVTAAAAAETGLAEGTPVVAGTMDLEAVALGSGVLDETQLVVSAGTWNIVVQILDRPALDPLPLMQAQCRDGSRYLLSEGSPTGAANLNWVLHEILHTSDPDWGDVNALVAGLPPEASSLIHLPFINGSLGSRQGGFLGITGDVGRAHLLRAVYEGSAFMQRLHAAELLAVTRISPRCGRLSGGVARSPVWSQIFADVLGMRIEVSEGSELGALGCAIMAAVAVGRHASLEDAVGAMSRIARTYEPDARRQAIYNRKYHRFLDVQKALMPCWGAFGED